MLGGKLTKTERIALLGCVAVREYYVIKDRDGLYWGGGDPYGCNGWYKERCFAHCYHARSVAQKFIDTFWSGMASDEIFVRKVTRRG